MGENMTVQDELELLKQRDAELQKLVRKEKRRLIKLLKDAGAPEAQIKMLEPIASNVAWMKVKLDRSMEMLKGSQLQVRASSNTNNYGKHTCRE